MAAYSPAIDPLLHLGWNYGVLPITTRFGLTAEHIPELVQLATDRDLWLDWHEPESIGTSHALDVLAELGAIEHVPHLLDFICDMDRDYQAGDWVTEEMADWLFEFGPKGVPVAKAELRNADRTSWMRSAAAKALLLWADDFPDLREEAVAAITDEIDRRDRPNPELNGLLLSQLLILKAIEAAPIIERAFADKLIDERIGGDWPRARYQLGLGPKPPDFYSRDGTATPRERADQRKAKRKAEKRARKRNRSRR